MSSATNFAWYFKSSPLALSQQYKVSRQQVYIFLLLPENIIS